jgi:hypothetical protein
MNVPFSAESLSVFMQTLVIMVEGMAGIFVFMAIFYGLITLLKYIFKEKEIKEL